MSMRDLILERKALWSGSSSALKRRFSKTRREMPEPKGRRSRQEAFGRSERMKRAEKYLGERAKRERTRAQGMTPEAMRGIRKQMGLVRWNGGLSGGVKQLMDEIGVKTTRKMSLPAAIKHASQAGKSESDIIDAVNRLIARKKATGGRA